MPDRPSSDEVEGVQNAIFDDIVASDPLLASSLEQLEAYERRGVALGRTCVECGAPLPKGRGDMRYCTTRCRMRAAERRRRR